jgi:ABC-type nitrate/sulfonate/bicarbonate transport system substrate-binding protein
MMTRLVIKKMAYLVPAVLLAQAAIAQTPQNITINYPAKAPANWPLFVAKDGGYYQKYGFNANLVFGVSPTGIAMVVSGEAVMTNYSLEQAMLASSRDGSLVLVGSLLNRALFALMGGKGVNNVRELKGKRIGVSQIGDPPYNFAVAMIGKFGLGPRDVEWIPLGTDGNGRVAALVGGRVDATMVPPPAYFKLEPQGYKMLANLADYDELYAPMVYIFKRSAVAANPKLPEQLLRAEAEATKRIYDDREFAIKSYMAYDPQTRADVERIYDHDRMAGTYERVPYVLAEGVTYIANHQADAQIGAQMKAFDFRKVIDNTYVDRLVKEGFFEKLFGPGIKAEEEKKSKLAFR